MSEPTKHKASCEGHVECPRCGTQCGKIAVRDPDGCPATVVCLGCYRAFAIEQEEPAPCPTAS